MEVVKILGLHVSVEFELVPDIKFDSEETVEGPLFVIQRDHVILVKKLHASDLKNMTGCAAADEQNRGNKKP